MNTKKHNQRKRKRGEKNLFWLTRSTLIGSRELRLYNRKPYKLDYSYAETSEYYYDKVRWFSCHDVSFPRENLGDRFPGIDHNFLIPIELTIDNENPDMLIQRKKDNLFIASSTIEVIKGTGEEIQELRYPSRISPKLFPEVTEESGIIGVRINEKKEI
jgi:hypothetical protein